MYRTTGRRMQNQETSNNSEYSSYHFITLEELASSRIYYELTIPDVIKKSFNVIVLFFLIFIIYIFVAPYDVVVKATGTIIPSGECSQIIPLVSGTLKEKYFSSGQKVTKGQRLYTIENDSIKKNIETLEYKIRNIEDNLASKFELLRILEDFITSKDFDFELKTENPYIKSVLSQIQQLKNALDSSKIDYEREFHLYPTLVSKAELEKYEKQMNDDLLILRNYIFTQKSKTEDEIQILKQSKELEKFNLSVLENEFKKTIITATSDGFIEEIQKTVIGDNILDEMLIAKIIPDDRNELNIEIYISSKDIAEIKENQPFFVTFPKYISYEYSKITGFIKEISREPKNIYDETFFIIKGKLDESYILQKRTMKKIELLNGMKGNCKIITNKEPLYLFILNKMGLLNKK